MVVSSGIKGLNMRTCELLFIPFLFLTGFGCTQAEEAEIDSSAIDVFIDFASEYPNFFAQFNNTLDLDNVYGYNDQNWPNYITEDNSNGQSITNSGALLGRILFYDQNLSSDNSVSCATCHQQAFAFSDPSIVSVGVNGVTGRHSMRLINARFADEDNFFWDERAANLEAQTTMPIRDHNEMGFSGEGGAPDFDDLLEKLSAINYYSELFDYAFGDSQITEVRIQSALAQFIRSIQSFDSPYDIGRTQVGSDNANFPNFTNDQNAGKSLFMLSRNQGGANCATCHRPPEFDIRPNSLNNGVIGVFGSADTDLTVTRSPSLRDLVRPDGIENGPFMHDGSLTSLNEVIDHYDTGITDNSNLDNRLQNNGSPQNLNLTTTEKEQLVEFLKTLTGSQVYTEERWSDPFN